MQRGTGTSSALRFQMAKMEKGEKEGKKTHPTLPRERRRPAPCPEVTPSCLVLALLCTNTSLAVLCAWPSCFSALSPAAVRGCPPAPGKGLRGGDRPCTPAWPPQADPLPSITTMAAGASASWGTLGKRPKGETSMGEHVQVGKINSYVETGSWAAVYGGSTSLTLRGGGSCAPQVLSWVGNAAISQLVCAQQTLLPMLLSKPCFRRKEKSSARGQENGRACK